MPPRAELLPGVAAEPPVESRKPAITANDGRAQLRLTAPERERDARRRFQAAIAVALDSLRRAQARFDESSASIDLHIQQARAAVAGGTRFTLHRPHAHRATALCRLGDEPHPPLGPEQVGTATRR